MFSEILKIIPRLDVKGLNKMTNTLSARFGKVAKKFGSGLKKGILGGGILGAGLAVIGKILNPLKETQEALDRMLKTSDDLSTNATQFNTTAGKLFKLQQFGVAAGLDTEKLYDLMVKFQAKVAEAARNPTKPSVVSEYVKDTDTAESFFKLLQNLKSMESKKQVDAQAQIFGRRDLLDMAELMRMDFAKVQKTIGLKSADVYTGSVNKIAGISDLNDALQARRNARDLEAKGGIINKGMIYSRDAALTQEQNNENKRLQSYKELEDMNKSIKEFQGKVEEGMRFLYEKVPMVLEKVDWLGTKLGQIASQLVEMTGKIQKFFGGGVRKWFGGGGE